MFGVPLGRFFADPEQMADVIIRGFRTFGYDGVQLSLGVTAEPEAVGARVEHPTDGAPILREHLLSDPENLARLKEVNPLAGGSFPRFRQALERVMAAIGEEAFVIVNLRGPFLTAAQLRGVERLLMDTIESPDLLDVILEATAEVALRLGLGFLDSGAHALVLGEATCSPNFIPPGTYRRFVHDRHRRLVGELRRGMGRRRAAHLWEPAPHPGGRPDHRSEPGGHRPPGLARRSAPTKPGASGAPGKPGPKFCLRLRHARDHRAGCCLTACAGEVCDLSGACGPCD